MGHKDADLDSEIRYKLQHKPRKRPAVQPDCRQIMILKTKRAGEVTYRVEEHSEEQLSSVDELVQLLGASRVLVIENGVCEEAARLPWQHLRSE